MNTARTQRCISKRHPSAMSAGGGMNGTRPLGLSTVLRFSLSAPEIYLS